MSFKNYTAVSVAATDVTVFTTGTGVTTLILSTEITATTASNVSLKKHNGTAIYQEEKLVLAAGDTAVLDHKMVIPAGHSLQLRSDTATVNIVCNVLEQ